MGKMDQLCMARGPGSRDGCSGPVSLSLSLSLPLSISVYLSVSLSFTFHIHAFVLCFVSDGGGV